MTRLAPGLILLALIARAAVARGDPPPRVTARRGDAVALGWTRLPGAESCIDARALARAVERRLGRVVFSSPSQAALTIEGRVERTAQPLRWRATLTALDARGAVLGTRELTSDRAACRSLDPALALIVAVLVDPDATFAATDDAAADPPSAGAATTGSQPASTTTPPPPPTTTTTTTRVVVQRVPVYIRVTDRAPRATRPPGAWRVDAAARSVFAFGLLPLVGFGAQVAFALAPPPGTWAIEAAATAWAAPDAVSDAGRARVLLAHGGLALCPTVARAWTRIAVELCAGAQFGALRATGVGFERAYGPVEHWVALLEARGRFTVRVVGPLVVQLGAGATVPLVRPRLVYGDARGETRELFQPWPVTLAMEIGAGLRFP